MLKLGKESNYRKDKLEQHKIDYLRNTIFCNTKQLFDYNFNWIFHGIFLETINRKIKQSLIIFQKKRPTTEEICTVASTDMSNGIIQQIRTQKGVRTWFLSISTINERASSLIEESESSSTSSTAVKIWLKYCNYTMKLTLHKEDKSNILLNGV